MVDPDRRPTAQEIEELIDLVRRDPSSPAFIDLGEAYLALGRPRDAIQVGNLGLEQAPDSLEGRVMLARAYAALHQWKEAQGELLRVVKVDRSSRSGFALLGEVLLRRSDFERAVPVLQHAQNLDPTSPQILSMLRRARAGQPLDPPAAIPQPVAPRGVTDVPVNIQRSNAREPARPPPPAPPRSAPPPPKMSARVPAAAPMVPTMSMEPARQPPPAYDDAMPAYAPEPAGSRSTKQAPAQPPPQGDVGGVRPRVISSAKPQNAAAASLRQSAAVGESYLNDLLTGGLLDVAGVRVPDADFDLRPDRRWGRSTRRAFVFLFVVLVLGIGGGGGWYWWTEKQKAEAVDRLQHEAKLSIAAADFNTCDNTGKCIGLESAYKKLVDALDKDKNNVVTLAYIAETAGIEALLYGSDPGRVDDAVKGVGKDIAAPTDKGARELVIGQAAVGLARLYSLSPAEAITTLNDVNKRLDEYLAANEGDKWARWLKGRALLAAGDRKGGRAMVKAAADGDDGLIVAMIDQADLLVDDGQLDEAVGIYDRVLKRSKDHPLAVVGRALGRAESSVDSSDAINDLSVTIAEHKYGSRVDAYRYLALSLAQFYQEDYKRAGELLQSALSKPPGEPRFWARVVWAQIARGDISEAGNKSRNRIHWITKDPKTVADDPSVKLDDAALLLASGLPDKALDITLKLDGVRARVLRVYALLDLGKPRDALTEAEDLLKKAPDNAEAQILREQARMESGSDKERAESADALDKLGRKFKTKLGRHALGAAYFFLKDYKKAQEQFETANTDLGVEAPNPLEYRTRTLLATILFDAGKLDDANKQIDLGLKANPGYHPANLLKARILVKQGDPDKALVYFKPPYDESAIVQPEDKLAFAEALITAKKTGTAKEQDEAKGVARKLLDDVKDKITPVNEVSRVAALLDPKLPKEMGLPEPTATPPAGAEPKKCPGGHRHC
jgi:tetratricopeptide (TPR) repeat protein